MTLEPPGGSAPPERREQPVQPEEREQPEQPNQREQLTGSEGGVAPTPDPPRVLRVGRRRVVRPDPAWVEPQPVTPAAGEASAARHEAVADQRDDGWYQAGRPPHWRE